MKPDNPIIIHAGNVRNYLTRFMDGETSNAEEAALCAYFRSHGTEADPELAPYRDMLEYLMTGMPDAALSKPQHRRLRYSIAAAAAACVIIATVFYGWRQQQAWEQFAATYEGSYMIIDGERISDLQQLRPELLALLHESEKTEQRVLEALRQQQEAEQCLLEGLLENAEDPGIRQLIENTLNMQVNIP